MRRLVVMRHAKSDWNAGASSDHDRPLNDRGRREAPQVAKELARLGYAPEFVLSSDSRRTVETLELARSQWPGVRVELSRALYHAGLSEVREAVTRVPTDVVTLLLLGHNPGWETMVSELSGRRIEMKTSYAAVLESPAQSFAEALAPGARLALLTVVEPG